MDLTFRRNRHPRATHTLSGTLTTKLCWEELGRVVMRQLLPGGQNDIREHCSGLEVKRSSSSIKLNYPGCWGLWQTVEQGTKVVAIGMKELPLV